MNLRQDADTMIRHVLARVQPDAAVKEALARQELTGPVTLVAIGKAAWSMANAAVEELGDQVRDGIVITKYHHSQGPIPRVRVLEAGHPVVDEQSILATREALRLTAGLSEQDLVLFLISGGGSALFEEPMAGVELPELMAITEQLLRSGADITEINTVRKHLSQVKGGKFARHCSPAQILSIVLSDVLGDPLDVIASGPAYPDASTSEQALAILARYGIRTEEQIPAIIRQETPKALDNVETIITGSVTRLCTAAAEIARELGYEAFILSSTVDGEAREVGQMFAALAGEIRTGKSSFEPPCALIAGGETVVRIIGTGKGGRNQELALACARGIDGLEDLLFFSLGSDGTDGPTDAAGGIVDGTTAGRLRDTGCPIEVYLDNNDSYHGLQASGGLLVTGPTGTNVNDLMVLLVSPRETEH